MVLPSWLVEYRRPTTYVFLPSYGRGKDGMERIPRKGMSGAGADPSLWVPRVEVAVTVRSEPRVPWRFWASDREEGEKIPES